MTERVRQSESNQSIQDGSSGYASLVDALPLGLVVHTHGVVRYANAAAARLLAAPTPDALLGIKIISLVHPDFQAEVIQRMAKVYESEESASLLRETLIKLNGEEIEVEVIGTIGVWEGEQAVQVVFQDISDRLKTEREAERLSEELHQARRLETVGRLAGGIAHDFNNALTGILGYTELIELTHGEDIDLMSDIRQIRRATERAADLTRNLSAFSRRRPRDPVLIDLELRLHDLQSLVSRLLVRNTVDFEVTAGCWPIGIDPVQFEQIIMNLAVNARDAMERGHFGITVANVVDEGEWVEFVFSDQGEGIAPENLAKVFEPFFTTRLKGTGLGLSMVNDAVQAHGGTARITSELGIGTTVTIRFPRAFGEVSLDAASSVANMLGDGETILVIDDDPLVLRLTKRALEAGGYNVVSAVDSAEGEAKLRSNADIVMVLSDVLLPGRSGIEFREEIAGAYPDLKFTFMSGYVDDRVGHDEVSTVDYLSKPFTTDALLRWVRDAFI